MRGTLTHRATRNRKPSHFHPKPATTDGRVIFAGHIGTIYQAKGAAYLGRSKPGTIRLLPDGRILSPRAISKIRVRDQGWRYSAAILEKLGAAPLGEREDAKAWLARWLPALTRTMRHEGNLKYAFGLAKSVKRRIAGLTRPYLKFARAPSPS